MSLVWLLWGFKIWMIFDVLTRRRGPIVWIALVLLIPWFTVGGVVYFMLAKAIDWGLIRGLDHGRRLGGSTESATARGIAEGQTAARRLAAADQLELREVYPEATLLYESVLEAEPNHLGAMHGLARCKLGTGHPDQACRLLQKVLDADREFGRYAAALDYAEALNQSGQTREAIGLLEGLAEHTKKPNHWLALAHYLASDGEVSRAVKVLENARTEYLSSSSEARDADRKWFDRIELKLRELST